jgi:RimJ/RimL family protein N-acetyltransferase
MKNVFFFLISCVSGLASAALENYSFEMQLRDQKDKLYVVARPATEEDWPYFKATYGDEKAMSQYMNGGIRPDKEIEERLKLQDGRTKADNPWNVWLHFASTSKQDLEKMTIDNFFGLMRYEPSDREGKGEEIEISYVLPPKYWRRGIGTKFIEEFLKKAYEWRKDKKIDAEDGKHYFVNSIYATARADNPGSCGVLEKNGFEKEYDSEKFGVVRRFYSLRLTPEIPQSLELNLNKEASQKSTSAEGSLKGGSVIPGDGSPEHSKVHDDDEFAKIDGDSSEENDEKKDIQLVQGDK